MGHIKRLSLELSRIDSKWLVRIGWWLGHIELATLWSKHIELAGCRSRHIELGQLLNTIGLFGFINNQLVLILHFVLSLPGTLFSPLLSPLVRIQCISLRSLKECVQSRIPLHNSQ